MFSRMLQMSVTAAVAATFALGCLTSKPPEDRVGELERRLFGVGLSRTDTLTFGPDGKTLVSVHVNLPENESSITGGPNEYLACTWNLASTKAPTRKTLLKAKMTKPTLSHDGAFLADMVEWQKGRDDGRLIAVWDARTGEEVARIPLGLGAAPGARDGGPIAFRPDGKIATAVTPGRDGVVQIRAYDPKTGRLVDNKEIPPEKASDQGASHLSFSRDGKTFLLVKYDRFQVRRTEDGKLVSAFEGADLVSKKNEAMVNVGGRRVKAHVTTKLVRVNAIDLSPSGDRVAVSFEPSTLYATDEGFHRPAGVTNEIALGVYDLTTRTFTSIPRDRAIDSVAFHPSGKVLALGLWGRTPMAGEERDRERMLIIFSSINLIPIAAGK